MNLLEQVMLENLRAQQERQESYSRMREIQNAQYVEQHQRERDEYVRQRDMDIKKTDWFVWGCVIVSITISLLSLLS